MRTKRLVRIKRNSKNPNVLLEANLALAASEDQLIALNLERDTIRAYYYEQKNALREKRKEIGNEEYYDQLNALKSVHSEQCDMIFDKIRTCKLKIDKWKTTIADELEKSTMV